MEITQANRLADVPPYLFARIDKIKEEEYAKGKKLISLAIGDPDLPTPDFIIDRLVSAARKPSNHQYPSYWGMKEFRSAIANWYGRRFDVDLDPTNEVLGLIGSKEGIAHIPLAFVNPGERVLCPNPGYPVYSAATILAGGTPAHFDLKKENSFLPDISELEKIVSSGPRVRLLFLNYPNNPTAACATLGFFEEVVAFAKKHEIIVCHDNAYSEIYFDGKAQPSFLQAKGAKDVGIEFHSVSKTYNMTGWRIGSAAGNKDVIAGLAQVKTNIDSGPFNACQEAAIEALENGDAFCTELRQIYQARRDILVPAIREAGLECPMPEATFYLWTQLKTNQSCEDFVLKFIREKGIVTTPGTGFGSNGQTFVRFTLCNNSEILKQVAQELKKSI